MYVTLHDYKGDDLYVNTTASINKNDCLNLTEVSGGKRTEEILGSTQAEFFVDLDFENTKKFVEVLTKKVSDVDVSVIKKLMLENFEGNTALSKFKNYCTENNITYTTFSSF